MNTSRRLKIDMLDVCSVAADSVAPPKSIHFYDQNDVLLCNVGYGSVVAGTGGDVGKIIFKPSSISSTGPTTIKGLVLTSGTVKKFTISGMFGTLSEPTMLSGSVGSVGSKSDMIFNKIAWIVGSTVRLKLSLYLK